MWLINRQAGCLWPKTQRSPDCLSHQRAALSVPVTNPQVVTCLWLSSFGHTEFNDYLSYICVPLDMVKELQYRCCIVTLIFKCMHCHIMYRFPGVLIPALLFQLNIVRLHAVLTVCALLADSGSPALCCSIHQRKENGLERLYSETGIEPAHVSTVSTCLYRDYLTGAACCRTGEFPTSERCSSGLALVPF